MPVSCSSMVENLLRSPASRLCRIAMAGAVLLAAGAEAQENRFGRKPNVAASPTPASQPECTCRAQGQSYRVGTETCLHINGISRIFRCDMDLNVTSWKPTGLLCPVS